MTSMGGLIIKHTVRAVVAAAGLTAAIAAISQRSEAPTGFDNRSNGVVDDSTHQADQEKFDEVEAIADGLGPLYNAQSCRECHQNPTSGGPSQITELRVGHRGPDGRFKNADIPIARGRVEAVAEETLLDLAHEQRRTTHGQIHGQAVRVPIVEAPGATGVGRFGWKDQHASLLSFSGDAYVNEMGITSRLFPDEVTILCNTVTEPNDKPDSTGLADIDRFARFIRATKAPARDTLLAKTPKAKTGSALFDKIGCAICHVRTLTTAAAGTAINGGTFTIPPALGQQTFHPFGDFLLHNVGTGDGIVMAMPEHYGRNVYQIVWKAFSLDSLARTQNKVRTAPLWGVRLRPRLMHDQASLTLRDAIVRHGGEASGVTQRFRKLSRREQQAIVEFLKSL